MRFLAHAGPVAPEQVWSTWSAEPTVLAGIGGYALLYAVDAVVAPDRGRRGRHSRRRAAAAVAVATLLVALVSPLDAAAEALFSYHMVQHLLLSTVAAPMIVLAAPAQTLRRLLPPAGRAAAGWAARRTASPGRHRPGAPVVVGTSVAVLTMTAWHVPAAYDAALRVPAVHALEHATILLSAIVFWATVVRAARRVQTLSCITALAVASIHGAALGALLALAPRPWYAGHVAGASRWGVDALADQQVAGAIMWVPAAVVPLGAVAVVLHRALREPAGRPVGHTAS